MPPVKSHPASAAGSNDRKTDTRWSVASEENPQKVRPWLLILLVLGAPTLRRAPWQA